MPVVGGAHWDAGVVAPHVLHGGGHHCRVKGGSHKLHQLPFVPEASTILLLGPPGVG